LRLCSEEGGVGAEHLVQRGPTHDPAWKIGFDRELPGLTDDPMNL
jgi:hypothetical protein